MWAFLIAYLEAGLVGIHREKNSIKKEKQGVKDEEGSKHNPAKRIVVAPPKGDQERPL